MSNGNEALALVIFCAASGWIVAIIAVVGNIQRGAMTTEQLKAMLQECGIDVLRLRMLLDPPRLPQGGGARDPQRIESFEEMKRKAGR